MLRLSSLYRFPLKSGKGESLSQARLDKLGLVGDRRWMLVDEASGRFLTQRADPKMSQRRLGTAGIKVDHLDIALGHTVCCQQVDRHQVPVGTAKHRDLLALKVFDGLDVRALGHRQIEVGPHPQGRQQLGVQAVGASDHRRQIPLIREVQLLIGQSLVDRRACAFEEEPLHFGARASERFLQQLLVTHDAQRRASFTFVQQGEQKNTGIELAANGQATDRLNVFASVAAIRSRVTGSGTPEYEGHQTINVPTLRASLYGDYALPWVEGLALLGGVQYSGKKYANQQGAVDVASYAIFNIGSRYSTRIDSYDTVFRLTIDNLFDKRYWRDVGEYMGDNYVFQGAPLTATLSASINF